MIVEMKHEAYGRIKVVGHPVKYSKEMIRLRSPPPVLGQHTDEVMLELGYT